MLILSFLACFEDECPPGGDCVDCPDIAILSSAILLADADGVPIEGATVEWSVDGSDFEQCEAAFDDAARYECGWGRTGEFVVRASAEGFESGEVAFTVGASEDGCTAATEVVDLVLDGPICTAEVVPAVSVTVLGADASTEVFWSLTNADMAPEPCDFQTDELWTCADEVSGNLAIEAFSDFGSVGEVLDVEHDGCHPITELLELSLPVPEGDPDEPAEG